MAFFLTLVGASGCVIAPFIESVRQVGATKSHRMELLEKEVNAFQAARYWKDMSVALGTAKESARPQIKEYLRGRSSNVKVVDSKIVDAEFSPDAFEAEVEVESRVYELNTLQVRTEREKQSWIFSIADGWKVLALSLDGVGAATAAQLPVK